MARRVKFVSNGSGLDVQLELRLPGHPYAALVAADWPEARVAYVVVAPTFGAYAFMQRELADELERSDLTALTAALGLARSQPAPITSTLVTFDLDGPVRWSEPTTDRPTDMPEATWTVVVERLLSFDHAERERENTERSKFRATFDRRAMKLLPSMCRQDTDPAIDQSLPLTHKISQGTVQLKRGERKVGRYYPSERVLILVDEEERTAAIQYLQGVGEDPRRPLNGSRTPSLRGQVNFFEDHYFVVYSEGTHQGTDYQYDHKIAVFSPMTGEMLTVVPAWSDASRELLEAHGLHVKRDIQPADAKAPMYQVARRLAWDKRQLDPAGAKASDEKSFGKSDARKAFQAATTRQTLPSKTLNAEVAAALPPAAAEAVGWLLESRPDYGPSEWDPELASWNHRMAVLNEKQLADLAAAVEPIPLSPSVANLVDRARRASPAHASLLAAIWSREFEPEWFASLPWQDRELPVRGGGEGIQGFLEEMSDRQVSQSAQPRMVRLLMSEHEVEYSHGVDGEYSSYTVTEPAFPDVDLDPDLTQNDIARIWLAVTSFRQNELVAGCDSFEHRVCLVCQRPFPVGTLRLSTVNFTRSDKICRECANAAYYGRPSATDLPDSVRSDAMTQALRELATILGTPPTRDQLTVPLDCSDDVLLAQQIALRMVVSRKIGVRALHEAELLSDAYRPSFGVYSIASDGHECRSLFERQVDDFLSSRGIPHEVEPPYPRDDLLNSTGLRGDWLLPDGTFVEAAGLTNPSYLAKLETKRELATKNGIGLIILTSKDLTSLDARFAKWLGDQG